MHLFLTSRCDAHTFPHGQQLAVVPNWIAPICTLPPYRFPVLGMSQLTIDPVARKRVAATDRRFAQLRAFTLSPLIVEAVLKVGRLFIA